MAAWRARNPRPARRLTRAPDREPVGTLFARPDAGHRRLSPHWGWGSRVGRWRRRDRAAEVHSMGRWARALVGLALTITSLSAAGGAEAEAAKVLLFYSSRYTHLGANNGHP